VSGYVTCHNPLFHHAEKWSIQHRGNNPYQVFIPMATRQSDRGPYRHRLMSSVRQMPNVQLPAPPPILCPHEQYVPPTPQPLSPLPDPPPTHQQLPTTTIDILQCIDESLIRR